MGFRVQGLGFWSPGFRVLGIKTSGSQLWGLAFKV